MAGRGRLWFNNDLLSPVSEEAADPSELLSPDVIVMKLERES